MYKISNNPTSIQSKEDISNAFIELLNNRSYEDISISLICKKALITRQTYYRNFKNKSDILRYILDNIGNNFIFNYKIFNNNVSEIINNYFEYLLNYKNILKIIQKNELEYILKDNIKNMLSCIDSSHYKIYDNIDNEFIFDFIISTLVSVLTLWVKHDFKENPKEVSNMTLLFLKGILDS